jgi:hypothetical protein
LPDERELFGDEEIRTPDILLAKQALYQLSYVPASPAFGAAARKPILPAGEMRGLAASAEHSGVDA